jgi:hypothetical protein
MGVRVLRKWWLSSQSASASNNPFLLSHAGSELQFNP